MGYSESDNRERRDRERLEAEGYQLLLWSYRRELLGESGPRPGQGDGTSDEGPTDTRTQDSDA